MKLCVRMTTALFAVLLAFGTGWAQTVSWRSCLSQKPEWYGTEEAIRIADSVLLYQRESGGWPKNTDMARPLTDKQQEELAAKRGEADSTIDNGATITQMRYLARVATATGQERFREALLKGVDYTLRAQYENGGWPQFYPLRAGYYTHITFNDDAMAGVLGVLRDVSRREPDYAFVDPDRRRRSEAAVRTGIQCILRCQVRVDGKLTAWCAQHDEVSLQPAPARAYEKVSLSGSESVGVIRFLMGIDRPEPRVVEAVQAAVQWLSQVKLAGLRVVEKRDATLPGGRDRVVVQDPAAPPLWARFYEIGTNKPIFCGRDGVIKYSLAEIEHERRNGYSWYGEYARELLIRDYPGWQQKWAPGRNVLRS